MALGLLSQRAQVMHLAIVHGLEWLQVADSCDILRAVTLDCLGIIANADNLIGHVITPDNLRLRQDAGPPLCQAA